LIAPVPESIVSPGGKLLAAYVSGYDPPVIGAIDTVDVKLTPTVAKVLAALIITGTGGGVLAAVGATRILRTACTVSTALLAVTVASNTPGTRGRPVMYPVCEFRLSPAGSPDAEKNVASPEVMIS
jgi:hypothetical protein